MLQRDGSSASIAGVSPQSGLIAAPVFYLAR